MTSSSQSTSHCLLTSTVAIAGERIIQRRTISIILRPESDVIREQTLLAVEQLLSWDVELLGLETKYFSSFYESTIYLALTDRDLLALVVCYLLAVWSGLSGAVAGLLHFTRECFGHLGGLGWFRLVVPEFLFVGATHIRNNELNILLYQLTLLPRHWLTLVSASPDLLRLN